MNNNYQNQDHIYNQATGTTANEVPASQYTEKPVGAVSPPPAAHEPSYHQTGGQPMYHQDISPQPQEQHYVQQDPQQAQFKAPPPGFYEQQQQQQQQPQQQPQQVNNGGVNPLQLDRLQRYADTVHCPRCGATTTTRVEYHSGGMTHLTALLACFIACLGCIPYLVRSLKDSEHYCGSCGALLAVWHRSGHTEVVAANARPGNGPVNTGAGGAPPPAKYA